MTPGPRAASLRVALGLGLAVAAITAIGIPAHATYSARTSGDEPQYLLTAISLAHDGDLDISDELAAQDYRPFHAIRVDPQTLPLDDGSEISPHDPLLPALLAAPMGAGGWAAAKAALALFAGATAAVTWWVCVARFGVGARLAAAVVGAFALSAPLAVYATQVYPEIPAALATVIAVGALTGIGVSDRATVRHIAVASVAIVCLPWLGVKYLPVACALAASLGWRLRADRHRLVWSALALAAAAVTYIGAHRLLYGGWTVYATGDHFVDTGELSVIGTDPDYVGRSRRLLGLLVDRGFGLAAWAPAILAAVPAMAALARRRPAGTDALVGPVLAAWLTATFVALTMHGWWWPGRQVVVIVPLLVIAVAWWADRWISSGARRSQLAILGVALVLGSATWVWTTIEAVTRRRALIVDFEQTANPWYRLWHSALPDGAHPTLRDDVLTTAWWVVIAVAACWGWRSVVRPRCSRLTAQEVLPMDLG
ncbi:MAG: hypothetical protein KDB21_15115 [Acidimicrobiales bacterium]|nr:hypothetical protein [Acidimicrobiales bacterium]